MSEISRPATAAGDEQVRVWDPFVRLFHWGVAGGFAISYLSGGEIEKPHVFMGYIIAALLLARWIWGVVGPRRARFTDFVYKPRTVLGYLRDLVTFRAKRHLGHSPAGGAMVVALMISLSATVGVGMTLYAVESGKGPLSSVIAYDPPPETQPGEEEEDSALVELHEAVATITLWLVILHLGGVALASLVHRENLVRAMISGRKRP